MRGWTTSRASRSPSAEAGPAWPGIRGTGIPCTCVFLIVSGDSDPDQHVLLLAEIARTLRDRALMQLVITARSAAEAWRLLVTRGYGEQGEPSGRLGQGAALPAPVRARAFRGGGGQGSERPAARRCGGEHRSFIADLPTSAELILVTSSKMEEVAEREAPVPTSCRCPFPTLDRFDQVELALLFAVSRGLLARGDTVVSLSGVPSSGFLDTLLVIDVGREFPTVFAKAGGYAPGRRGAPGAGKGPADRHRHRPGRTGGTARGNDVRPRETTSG